MKAIVLSFTLKGQDFAQIAEAVKLVKEKTGGGILIHGFMPKEEVLARGYSTEVVDILKELFPVQLNMYHDGAPLRAEMADVAKQMNAEVFVIGEIVEGVAEELSLYGAARLKASRISLTGADGDKLMEIVEMERKTTFGEQLVGISFNPANDDKVGKAKKLFADAADLLNDENNSKETTQFSQRLFSHAVGEILNAQMNVVKVLTLKY